MAQKLLPASLAFDPADARAALDRLPASPAVFSIELAAPPVNGSSSAGGNSEARSEPYIGRTPNLRARLERLLQPSARHPRRLQLAARVRRIDWRLTGSEFESLLVQFNLHQKMYGDKAIERMHLRAPAFVRFLGANAYPRIVVTHRPSQREAGWAYGPFPSRAAAERFADETLKLFLLRRCVEDLDPNPSHPGCVYAEMKMCLAPCYRGCTDERYSEEAASVERFLATRGESQLVQLRVRRDAASDNLEFEAAAALHAQAQRVEAVRAIVPDLVRPLARLRAVLLQASATPGEVAVFLYENGCWSGPAGFSTQEMRIQNEHSGSPSLFAHPLAIEPLLETSPAPLEPIAATGAPPRSGTAEKPPAIAAGAVRGALEARMETVLAALSAGHHDAPSATLRQGHLALLKRWYYHPEARRAGEIFFPEERGAWPIKALVRGVGRVAARSLAPSVRAE
ncbi:MAG: excinuclease ABC subunit C [Terracidiphilus sp.]